MQNRTARILPPRCWIFRGHGAFDQPCAALHLEEPLPSEANLLAYFLADVTIKLAKQIFLRTDGITKISVWSKELALTLLTPSHRRSLALISEDFEMAICHVRCELVNDY